MKKEYYFKLLNALFFLYSFSLSGCSQSATGKDKDGQAKGQNNVKVNGLNFAASPKTLTEQDIKEVTAINANWVALVPYAFIRNTDSPAVQYNSERQWKGERIVGIKTAAGLFRKQGVKVMLKPQLWMGHGNFTGHLSMKTEDAWQLLERGYEKYILDFAKAAEETGCEMFCIGTELSEFVAARPAFWDSLIQKVKGIYHGKLTYAENWDSYAKVPFWSSLDYIGIDAYFPLSNKEKFSVKEIERGWQSHKTSIKSLSEKINLPVLFTEFGYRSSLYAAKEPWAETNNTVCLQNQETALRGLFNTFWGEHWFAGGFLWKWHDNKNAGGADNADYTPQNKPAEKLVRETYGNN